MQTKKLRIAIFPLKQEDEHKLKAKKLQIVDHINLTGSSPREIGFIPITDLYTKVTKAGTKAIKVVCIKNGAIPNEEQSQALLNQGIEAYTYELIPEVLYIAAEGAQIEAEAYIPECPRRI